ncbi:MAG: hypothetical protein C4297_02110 [Gemmataceae bacterium]
MKLLDRMLLSDYVRAGLIALVSLLSLYIVIDLFNKIDEFPAQDNFWRWAKGIAQYYSYQIVLIFDRLYAVMAVLAAMFTLAWLQRNNELVPLLAAGVPVGRLFWPIFAGTGLFLIAGAANREWLMPRVAEQLQQPAHDPQGEKLRPVQAAYDSNGVLVGGRAADPRRRVILDFTCTLPERLAGGLVNVTAREARYIPRGPGRYTGGWLLSQTTPADVSLGDGPLFALDPGKLFLKTTRVDYDLLTRQRGWYQFASTAELLNELRQGEAARLAAIAVQVHARLTLPLLTGIMVFMGLALLLRNHQRRAFLSISLSVLLAVGFYLVGYVARYLGENEWIAPALAAWAPILVFGPVSLLLGLGMQS